MSASAPRVRSSCDGCGAVKLKCDKTRPACGRCIAHGIHCVYSVSRRIGKPPRKSLDSTGYAVPVVPNRPQMLSGSSDSLMSFFWESMDGNSNDSHNDNNNLNNHDNLNNHNNLSNHNNSNNNHSPNRYGKSRNDSASDSVPNLDELLINSYRNSPDATMLPNVPLTFDDVTGGEFFDSTGPFSIPPHFAPGSAMTMPDRHTSSSSGTPGQPSWPSSDADGSSFAALPDHDCHRDAHELLGSSLYASPTWMQPDFGPSPPDTASLSGSGPDGVALDHLLMLNRKVSERLESLLTCSCAASPYLMLLYASLIATILTRYHHAAGEGPGSLSWRSNSATSLQNTYMSNGGSDTSAGIPTSHSGGPAVTPATFNIGIFSVDDHKVQSALRMHLLAGEVNRLAHLIDCFAACRSEGHHYAEDPSAATNTNALHQSLSLWLSNERSRIANMIVTKLKKSHALS